VGTSSESGAEHGSELDAAATAPLWTPDAERVESARITHFARWLEQQFGRSFPRYEDLWQWSVTSPEEFWSALWRYFDVIEPVKHETVISSHGMPHTQWFTGARLNFVDQVFRHGDTNRPAIIHSSEAAGEGTLSWAELERQVAAMAATLRDLGVDPGDRVAAYLPNIPAAVVALLAVTSIGAVWSVCAPDMGPVSVVDRFRQIEPKVLIACDGYRFAGRGHDRREALQAILTQLPTVQSLVWVPHLDAAAVPPVPTTGTVQRVVGWPSAVAGEHALTTVPVAAGHPLWILYSSGTTGLPKAIVHGHAGMIANGLLLTCIHSDVHAGDRVLWVSSTSWMVWNAHVMCLLAGATLVLVDGAPTGSGETPDWSHLWQLAARHEVTGIGAGAAFYHACMKAGVEPGRLFRLAHLKSICSTGSPLSTDGYRWLYQAVKRDVWVNCISGGTDICGAFVGGVPTLPVHEGEMQCRILGAAVHAFNEDGKPVLDEVGELVCTQPFPSMPLRFWGDPGDRRYLESYFDTFVAEDGARIWRHGDWMRLVPRAGAVGAVIYGRSDATINRQGIRMGTAELYRAVEFFPEITDSLVVDLEYLGRESWMALFVVMCAGAELDEALQARLRAAIRTALSPRHVPDEIIAVPDVPKTLTGKKLELPIKRLLLGSPIEKVATRDALANPASLDWYVDFARRRTASP
jgi:acetoacetyl-CoA synthetase